MRDFIIAAAAELGLTLSFSGEGINEKGYIEAIDEQRLAQHFAPDPISCHIHPGDCIIRIDPRYFRPTEVETLLGNPGKAAQDLGWRPTISLKEMVAEMICEDMRIARRDALYQKTGFHVYPEPE